MQRFLAHLLALATVSSPALAQPAVTPTPGGPATQPAAATSEAAAPTVLVPAKTWFAPTQPVEVRVAAGEPVTLVLTEFATGTKVEPKGSADVAEAGTTDVRKVFAASLDTPGTYVLHAVPKGKEPTQFLGTPLVIGVRGDGRINGPTVVKVEPLRYVAVTTSKGPMTFAFYYDVAPNTAANFLTLAGQGYYNGLTFHRVVKEFVIQGGDPRGDGMGGPGYQIDAEFNARPHHEGVLSMARSGDPNSAGSQFFVCLDYARTAQLDRKYTAFGRVVGPLDAVKAIGAVAVNESDRPLQPVTLDRAEVRNVTASDNPYAKFPDLLKGAAGR